MKNYEIMFLITDIEKTKTTIKSIEKFITDNNGEIVETECWEKRHLSYANGNYVLINFNAPEETAKKFKHVLSTNKSLKTFFAIESLTLL